MEFNRFAVVVDKNVQLQNAYARGWVHIESSALFCLAHASGYCGILFRTGHTWQEVTAERCQEYCGKQNEIREECQRQKDKHTPTKFGDWQELTRGEHEQSEAANEGRLQHGHGTSTKREPHSFEYRAALVYAASEPSDEMHGVIHGNTQGRARREDGAQFNGQIEIHSL